MTVVETSVFRDIYSREVSVVERFLYWEMSGLKSRPKDCYIRDTFVLKASLIKETSIVKMCLYSLKVCNGVMSHVYAKNF